MNRRNGFTLVELMVVIAIIGILAVLAIPRFLGAVDKSKAAEFRPVLKQIYLLENTYQHELGTYSDNTTDLGFEEPGARARFSYEVASFSQTTYRAEAILRSGAIRTHTGTATIDQDGAGGVSGSLAPLVFWKGIGN